MIYILGLLIFLFSCGIPMGDTVKTEDEKLTVFYLEEVSKDKAIKFLKYWKDNGFIGDDPQIIQLDVLEDGLIAVKLIEKSTYHKEALSIHEKSLLQELERNLEKKVFEQEVTIIITDNTFRPIERN
ncbi:MAG: hypothetical protein COA32_11690 [Fluviicola sp.]|nr:MAG: hypothetical protein COA32_11690 [Fluviicola sp.]